MSLNNTASANRIHIAFFGRRNAGKSSLVNAVTNQQLSVVSEHKGTTTDPVKKAMEILPLGPVVIIDTPGFDDIGDLGMLRVEKTLEILRKTDIAVLVVDSTKGVGNVEKELIGLFKERSLPYIIAYNKSDLLSNKPEETENKKENEIYISAKLKEGINELKNLIAKFADTKSVDKKILADLVDQGDTVVLVIPIDQSAPKGRLILPQQQVLREILDINATAVCCQDDDLVQTLDSLKTKPKIVITDSQVFGKVSKLISEDIPLTSFSILFARYKGNLETLVKGAVAIDSLSEGDKILISEGCTHHRQCNDIGSVKMPKWIENYTGKKFEYEFSSGNSFPQNLKEYKLIIHCGGCMLNEKEMQYRIKQAASQGVPIVNYGVAIAYMHSILYRCVEPFDNIRKILDKQSVQDNNS